MKDSQIEQLLALAAKKLNMSTDELKATAQSGDTAAILKRLSKDDAKKMESIMNNRQLTDEIMKKFKAND